MMTQISLPLSPARLAAVSNAYSQTRRAKQMRTGLGVVIFIMLSLLSAWKTEVSPSLLYSGIPRFVDYLCNLVPSLSLSTFAADMGEWYWGLRRWTRLLIDTILIAYVGTLSGTLIGGYLSYLASADLNKSKWLVFVTRRVLEFCRTVPEIVFALIFVVAFGLGPVPGVLAIMIHTIGAIGKLFAEVNENASPSGRRDRIYWCGLACNNDFRRAAAGFTQLYFLCAAALRGEYQRRRRDGICWGGRDWSGIGNCHPPVLL